jgi:glutathione S-transferase
MRELFHLPYSPWSEKARWALDIRKVPYERRLYQPLLGELGLRRMLGRYRGPVSVPVLRDGDRVIADSFEIARFADRHGAGPQLFPPGKEAEIARYNALSERGLGAGRALALARMLDDPDALREQVPAKIGRVLGPLGQVVATLGIKRTLRKYQGHRGDAGEHERVLCEVLDTLRADLANSQNEPRTLLSALTFADIAMAQVLVFVRPPTSGLRIREGSRRAFTHPALAERYADLLAWRDAFYDRYRAVH